MLRKTMLWVVNSAQLLCCLDVMKKKGPHDDSAIFKLNLSCSKYTHRKIHK